MTNKKYYNCFLSIFFIFICVNSYSQVFDYKSLDTIPEFTLEQALKKDPLTVYKLNLKKQKLVDLPESMLQFKNLQSLNISKNKLSHFPAIVFKFEYLQYLNASDNKASLEVD